VVDVEGAIEVVRGRMTEARADQVLSFWSREEVLEGAAARERLPEVVCVLIDDNGEIAGVNSVHAADVPLVGGRRFWIYRSFLTRDASGAAPEMFNAAFTALEEEFEPSGDGPIGLCLLVADPGERGPEAIWPETELMFAGYQEDGRQVRIRYFWDAIIGPGLPDSPSLSETRDQQYPLEERYRLEVLGETDAASPEGVIAFWESEGVVPPAEAQRRVHEVLLVAIEDAEGVVGVSSAYLSRSPRLQMDLWYFRIFVARAHRNNNLAVALAMDGRDLLEKRFVSGEDTRAAGIIYVIQNEGLKKYRNRAVLLPVEFAFIGQTEEGHHLHVRYFPGAQTPVPR
jgi:hypothetical protein